MQYLGGYSTSPEAVTHRVRGMDFGPVLGAILESSLYAEPLSEWSTATLAAASDLDYITFPEQVLKFVVNIIRPPVTHLSPS